MRSQARKAAASTTDRLALAAVGIEAELTLIVDDTPMDPAEVFGDPRGFIRAPLMHRIGTSYHVPNGAAVYFDTGVIEVATPAIELERGCMARAVRSLWDAIHFVRRHLDRWERENGRRARLQGFSAHYNVSVDDVGGKAATALRLERLARALVEVLPAPVMLLATNRRSTGVGVRPRRRRIEITADFTPHPGLMIATGSLVAGVVRGMAARPSVARHRLRRELPIMQVAPMHHTSRRGWLARFDCYPANPFACDVDAPTWVTSRGLLSLREIARAVFARFSRSIARVSDPLALRLVASIVGGRGATLLALDDRPAAYDDVGRLTGWDSSFWADSAALARSRYERVLSSAVSRRRLRLFGELCTPVAVRGWSRVVFRRDSDGAAIVLPLDRLVDRLPEWERGS
jgi:hypothetical protein